MPTAHLSLSLFGAAILAACHPALAADTLSAAAFAAPGTTVSLTDILTALAVAGAGILLAILRSVGATAVVWLQTHTRIRIDEANRVLLDDLCRRGIDYALATLEADIKGADLQVDGHDLAISKAAQYVLDHAPEAVAHFGLDQGAIARMVTARLGAAALAETQPAGASRPAAG